MSTKGFYQFEKVITEFHRKSIEAKSVINRVSIYHQNYH